MGNTKTNNEATKAAQLVYDLDAADLLEIENEYAQKIREQGDNASDHDRARFAMFRAISDFRDQLHVIAKVYPEGNDDA